MIRPGQLARTRGMLVTRPPRTELKDGTLLLVVGDSPYNGCLELVLVSHRFYTILVDGRLREAYLRDEEELT